MSEQAAKELVEKGVALSESGKAQDSLPVFDEVLQKFGSSTDAAVSAQVARASTNKGIALHRLNRHEEALKLFEAVGSKADGGNPKMREVVARALLQKANLLRDMGRGDESIAVCDSILKNYDGAQALAVPVAGALYSKAQALGSAGRQDEAMALYDTIVQRFTSSSDGTLKPLVAGALFSKAMTMRINNRNDAAMELYEEIIKRYGESTDASVRMLAEVAKQGRDQIAAQRKELEEKRAQLQEKK